MAGGVVAGSRRPVAVTPAGNICWAFATGTELEIKSSPATGVDGTVYVPSLDGNLYSVRPDGTERWHFRCGSYTESSPVVEGAGNVYVVVIVAAGIYAEYRVTPAGQGHTISGLSCEVAADGVVYFMSDRYLYAVQPIGSGLPPAKSSWPMFRANVRHTGRVGAGIKAN